MSEVPTRAQPADPVRWLALFGTTVLAAYGYVFLEWLFFATKPSFVATMGRQERLGLLLIAPGPVALATLAPLLLLGAAAVLTRRRLLATLLEAAGWVVPSVIVTAALLLAIDNFTWTLFTKGVASVSGVGRAGYVALAAGVLAGVYLVVARLPPSALRRRHVRALVALGIALVLASTAQATWRILTIRLPPRGSGDTLAPLSRLPNILILSTDGLDATRMSAYGYDRDTTPFIRRLIPQALVCENTLPNGTVTTGSVASLLTSKWPLRTGVLSQSTPLAGLDAYQHLPAILRRVGYAGIALVPGVADPVVLNLRDGFERMSGRATPRTRQRDLGPGRLALAYSAEVYFLEHLWERVVERAEHVTGRRRMVNPLREVHHPTERSDERYVERLIEFLEQSTRPVFAFVHLMGTHGPFAPRRRKFSVPEPTKSQRKEHVRNVYDDAVLDFDTYVDEVVTALSRLGKHEDTVLVIMSDHGSVEQIARIPLVFSFPGGAHRGRIAANTHLLDLAPTLLDYLGIPVPEWMDGRSLLRDPPSRGRPIFTVRVRRGPPHGGTPEGIALSVCDRVSEMQLSTGRVRRRPLPGHTAPCGPEEVPDLARERALLAAHLEHVGLDPAEVQHAARARWPTRISVGAGTTSAKRRAAPR